MSIRAKITQAVNAAFSAVGDLAQTVTLKVSSEGTYDFSTGINSTTVTESTVVGIVIAMDEDPQRESIGTPMSEVYIKEADLPNPKLYSVVSIASVDHSIISYKVEPGLVTLRVTEG
jgi:hypothetical protein